MSFQTTFFTPLTCSIFLMISPFFQSGSAVAEYRFERCIQPDAAGVSQHDIDRGGQRRGCW